MSCYDLVYQFDRMVPSYIVTNRVRQIEMISSNERLPITMLTDRVLVEIPSNDGDRHSRSGILIPATAQVAKRLVWAEVVAVGPNVRSIQPGNKVLFSPDDRYEVEVQGEDYLILRERDIHAVASLSAESETGLYL